MSQSYTEIFDEIISIMQLDSATCKDLGAGDADKYKALIRNDMPEREFVYTVKKYIASFGLEGHLAFRSSNLGHIDFEVMRYGDSLYVTEAAEDSKLKKGDQIIALDGTKVAEAGEENGEFLMDQPEERQGHLWSPILMFAKELTVLRDGKELSLPVQLGDKQIYGERYTYQELADDTLLIKLLDFADENAIRELYAKCQVKLDACKTLIIDVRNNGGGADTAFLPLLEYCYPEGQPVDQFFPKVEPVAINYSERNCDVRLQMLQEYFGDQIPEDIRPLVEDMKNQLLENRGKGFVPNPDQEEELGIVGKALPQKVWILTDQGCGSSGDAFVQMMSYSPKVEIVGRPTMGILDYSNVASATWGDFTLVYPTSRDGSLDQGLGMSHKGIPVDHYIPWTPEALERDLELEFVLERK